VDSAKGTLPRDFDDTGKLLFTVLDEGCLGTYIISGPVCNGLIDDFETQLVENVHYQNLTT